MAKILLKTQDELAHELVEAIKELAASEYALDNFESYLAYHFDDWLEDRASWPTGLVSEFKHFASIKGA